MGFLSEVVAATRTAIASPDYLAGLPEGDEGVDHPSLRNAIQSAGSRGALLVEFKRFSPGAESPELPERSPEEFVRSTLSAVVAGYSCVATEHRFRGSPRDVAALASRTALPVLFKDFIVDRPQLDAARRSGASAVLLIARLESMGLLTIPLAELAREAHSRRLEVLLEFHERSELKRAAGVDADMYGVNVRDLDSLRMEPDVAAATIRAASPLRPLLGMSGVASPDDARRFWDLGTDGILVGSAAARATDPAAFLRTLHRPGRGGVA
jgi:indole-3-glycerol phosphate synthase